MIEKFFLFVLLATCTFGCGPDGRQVRLCERVFAEIEGDTARGVFRVGAEVTHGALPGVALLFQAVNAPGSPHKRFVCRFKGGRFEAGQSELIGVTRLSGDELSLSALIHLRRRVGLD